MAQIAETLGQDRTEARPGGGVRFDWMVIVAAIWFVGGLFIDGWAHNNGQVDESFFTSWHAVFYTGFMAVAGVHLFSMYRNRHYGWLQGLPKGYELSLMGLGIFAVGGLGDMIWHIVFGIEDGVEALISPTHLILAVGMMFIMTGPIRAIGHRLKVGDESATVAPFPLIFSTGVIVFLLTFMVQYSYFFGQPWVLYYSPRTGMEAQMGQVAGVASIFITTSLLFGPLWLIMRRWTLPVGTFTFVLGLNGLLMGIMADELLIIPIAPIVGLIVDGLYARMKPGVSRPGQFRLFALTTPFILFTIYLLGMYAIGENILWSIHMVAGLPFLAAFTGLFLSFLTVPPPSLLD